MKADAGTDPPGAAKAIASPVPLPESMLLSELLSQMATGTIQNHSQIETRSSQLSTSSTISGEMTVQTTNAMPTTVSPVTLVVQSASIPSFITPPRVSSGASSIHPSSALLASSMTAVSSGFSSAPQLASAAEPLASTMSVHTTDTDHAVSIPTGLLSSNSHQSYTHTPVFWIALVLGTLAVIAILCTLVAWWVRFRSAKKRRNALDASSLPWNGDSNETGQAFEAKRIAHFRDAMGSDNGDFAGDLSGDRDVGEPRRGSVYHLPASIVQRGTADPFASSIILPRVLNSAENIRNGAIPDSASFSSSYGHYLVANPPPRRLSSGFSIQENARTLGPLQVANMVGEDINDASPPSTKRGVARTSRAEFGTPRERTGGEAPRFLGLEGNGLTMPRFSPQIATESATRKLSIVEDTQTRPYSWVVPAVVRPMQNVALASPPPNWDHLPPLPMPGSDPSPAATYGGSESSESWAMNSESDLANAFDANANGQPDTKNSRNRADSIPGRRQINSRESQELQRTSRKMSVSGRMDILHARDKDTYAHGGRNQEAVDSSWSTVDLDDNKIRPSNSTVAVVSQAPLVIRKKSKAIAMKRQQNDLYTRDADAMNRSSIANLAESTQNGYSGNQAPAVPPRIPRTAPPIRTETIRIYKSKDDITKRMRSSNMEPMARAPANSSASNGSDLSWFGLAERLDDKQQSAKAFWKMGEGQAL